MKLYFHHLAEYDWFISEMVMNKKLPFFETIKVYETVSGTVVVNNRIWQIHQRNYTE